MKAKQLGVKAPLPQRRNLLQKVYIDSMILISIKGPASDATASEAGPFIPGWPVKRPKCREINLLSTGISFILTM
ncbi:hypothetical protein AAEU42_05290 [Pseudoflavonifractor phocaeensis]|uniref:hypothetical protein n=1 Tax=Pseudoflavonifractor phocaeensis TaxID=1870988 RepID=UPI00313AAA0E